MEFHTKPVAGLLTIPQELRDRIYDSLIVDHTSAIVILLPLQFHNWWDHETKQVNQAFRALSTTCQQLNHEAKMHYFRHNIIALLLVPDVSSQDLAPVQPVFWHLRRFSLCHAVADKRQPWPEYVWCTVDLMFRETGLEWSVRVAANNRLEKAKECFNRAMPDYSTETEEAAKWLARAEKPALDTLQECLVQRGDLDVAMLLQLHESLKVLRIPDSWRDK